MSAARSERVRRRGAAPIAAGLALLLLLGAVGAGLRVPGLTLLAGLPGLGLLDYRTLSGEAFLPLRADYVNELLGTSLVAGAGAPATVGARAADPVRDVLTGLAPGRAEPVFASAAEAAVPVLEHSFTNDDFDEAVEVRRLPFAARTTTTHATREPDEPSSCASRGGTAWYRYTAKDDRPLVADSFGSDHAVSIAVFRGGRLPDLRMEACSTSPTGDAEVSLTPKARATYHFQLTGLVNGGTTVFRLRGLGTLTQVSERASHVVVNDVARETALSADGRIAAFIEGCRLWVVDRGSGRRELVSRRPNDDPACARYPSMSRDGRFVSFSSIESLIREDTNAGWDMYVHDRAADLTTRISVASDGDEGRQRVDELDGAWGALSGDGRYAAFSSPLDGLVDGDHNGESDVFVHDRRTGRTTIESVDRSGRPAGAGSSFPSISDDGRFVVFKSSSAKLAEADYRADSTGGRLNVFRRDRVTGTTQIVSVRPDGVADNQGFRNAMSSDGQVVAWTSPAAHLVAGDTNGISDVFLRDMSSTEIRRISVSTRGEQQFDSHATQSTDKFQLAAGGRYVSLSGDGRYVAFDSRAGNLVAGDTNGAIDVFVHDRSAASTIRVSVSTIGEQGDGDSSRPRISRDGQVICFESKAVRFTGSDPTSSEVFVHDRNGT